MVRSLAQDRMIGVLKNLGIKQDVFRRNGVYSA